MLGLELNHVSKRGPRFHFNCKLNDYSKREWHYIIMCSSKQWSRMADHSGKHQDMVQSLKSHLRYKLPFLPPCMRCNNDNEMNACICVKHAYKGYFHVVLVSELNLQLTCDIKIGRNQRHHWATDKTLTYDLLRRPHFTTVRCNIVQ